MDAVFGVADRVLVLIDGELAAQGTAQAVAQDATVRQRYLGQWWSASLNAVPRSGESASNTGGCLHA
jgi:branched-chain amino acid transport system ATP-binding protein